MIKAKKILRYAFRRTGPFMVLVFTLVLPSCFMFPSGYVEEEPPLIFETNNDGSGLSLEIEFSKGKSHYFPLMALWIEDTLGNYIQTLYVAESIATGIFGHGDASTGKWMPGEIRRPAALPYWGHQRGEQSEDGLYLPDPENPVPDAYTGATPTGSFILNTKTDSIPPESFYVFFEINQSWDWNRYWTNNRFPGDMDYHSSAQPALVYNTLINMSDVKDEYFMEPAGRGHHTGATGELFDDLHTLTTALNIAEYIIVRVKQ
ncbi:MAG: hypothetical protein R6U58_03860 [Bacteroidales bacterium]